jgi:transposase-like protein
MEIITGVERRRRWTLEEKLRIVAETEQPGAGIAEIARQYEISRGLLWNWRSQVRRGVLKATTAGIPADADDQRGCRLQEHEACRALGDRSGFGGVQRQD